MMIEVIDDLLTLEQNQIVKNTVFSNSFKWFVSKETSYGGSNDPSSFAAIIYGEGYHPGTYYHWDKIKSFFSKWTDGYNMLRVRVGKIQKVNSHLIHSKHVDFGFDHKTLLYYIGDSDGDTYFYNNDNIIKQVSPKNNRAVLFDGNIYHSSSTPINNDFRVAININFK